MEEQDLEAQIANQDDIARKCILCDNVATRKKVREAVNLYFHTCTQCGSFWTSHARELQIGLMQPLARRNLRNFVRAMNHQNEYPDLGDILVEYWRLDENAGNGGLQWLSPGVAYPSRQELGPVDGPELGIRLFRSIKVYDSPDPDDSIWLSLKSGRVRRAAPPEVPSDASHSWPSLWPDSATTGDKR